MLFVVNKAFTQTWRLLFAKLAKGKRKLVLSRCFNNRAVTKNLARYCAGTLDLFIVVITNVTGRDTQTEFIILL
jgi:hypothetical protein